MIIILTLLGAALLAYPIFAAIGLGLSLCVFAGILCLMFVIYTWFKHMRNNSLRLIQIQNYQHDRLTRLIERK